MDRELRDGLARRDSSVVRVRLATWAGVALGLVLTAVFTVAAAGSTHARRVVTHVTRARRRVLPPVTAPAPPLVSSVLPSETQSSPPASPAPAPAPAPAPVTPVVVSGGS